MCDCGAPAVGLAVCGSGGGGGGGGGGGNRPSALKSAELFREWPGSVVVDGCPAMAALAAGNGAACIECGGPKRGWGSRNSREHPRIFKEPTASRNLDSVSAWLFEDSSIA
eukprot:scaffold270559_cov29-Tisochrysis_lutea.AAC.4